MLGDLRRNRRKELRSVPFLKYQRWRPNSLLSIAPRRLDPGEHKLLQQRIHGFCHYVDYHALHFDTASILPSLSLLPQKVLPSKDAQTAIGQNQQTGRKRNGRWTTRR